MLLHECHVSLMFLNGRGLGWGLRDPERGSGAKAFRSWVWASLLSRPGLGYLMWDVTRGSGEA